MTVLGEGRLYIDGKLRKAEGGATYADISPWNGEVVGYAPDASAADMEEAIVAARRAFDQTDWSTNKALRRDVVWKLCMKLRENRDRLAQIASEEVGAAPMAIKFAHVDRPLGFFEKLFEMFDAIEWDHDMGISGPQGQQTHRWHVKEACGVVGAIIPWNVPFFITVGKVIPALLTGCTVILKPAPDTPFMATILGELAAEVGLPAGVLNVVSGEDPAMLGEMLVTDSRVDVISFTGSTGVGRRIMEKGAPTLKRLFLELGGKSALIVCDDAPDFARSVASALVCFHAGQGCSNITRLLIPRSRKQEAMAALEAAYSHYMTVWGRKDDPDNVMGPLVSKRQQDRVMGYIQAGINEGARLLAGGKIPADKGPGWFVEPTCFVDVDNKMKIAQEEIFGPVLAVIDYDDIEDAIRIANDSEYGLSGGVVTADPEKGLAIARRIRTGTIGVNGGTCIDVDLAFGGYKQSGIGKEWGAEGFDEFLETKAIGIRVPN